jgi:hypothetical protein
MAQPHSLTAAAEQQVIPPVLSETFSSMRRVNATRKAEIKADRKVQEAVNAKAL